MPSQLFLKMTLCLGGRGIGHRGCSHRGVLRSSQSPKADQAWALRMPGTSWIPSTNRSISGPSSTNQRLSPQNSAKLPVTLLWRRLSFDTFKVWEYQPDFIQVDILSLSSLFWSLFLSVQFHQLCVWSCFFPRYIMLSIRILSRAGSSWVVYLYVIHGSGWNFVISSASFRSVSVHLDPSVDRVGIDIRRAPGTQQVQNLELRVRRKSWKLKCWK